MILLRKSLTFTILAILISLSLVAPSSAGSKEVVTTIIDAYYDDLDGDGYADDVRLTIRAEFHNFGESDFEKGVEYGIMFGITLPSGLSFWHEFMDVDNRSTVTIDFNLINQALESGWYDATAGGFYREYKPCDEILFHDIIFDPPGGQHGGEPGLTFSKW